MIHKTEAVQTYFYFLKNYPNKDLITDSETFQSV